MAARATTGSEEESRSILPEDLIPGTKTVVIGACAPIHPRVGPAVRPDVSHPWRTVVFAIRFRNLFAPAYVRAYAVSYFVDDNSDVGVPSCQPVSPCPA